MLQTPLRPEIHRLQITAILKPSDLRHERAHPHRFGAHI